MKSMLVIGLGRFGRHLAMEFTRLGNEVLAVDINEEEVEKIAQHVTSAQIGDCTKSAVLRSLGVRNFDYCVVCLSSNFEASLEVTLQLKELGAKRVIAKAGRDIHAKFLARNGADEVVYPEKQRGEQMAKRLNANNVFDYFDLTENYSIIETPVRENWVGKTIAQVNVRARFNVSILASKRGEQIQPIIHADYVFAEGEHLLLFGRSEDLVKFTRKA